MSLIIIAGLTGCQYFLLFEGNPLKVEKPQRGAKEVSLAQKLKGLDKGLAKSGTEKKLGRWW